MVEKTTIIIPTYNEKNNIEIIIPKIFSQLPGISVLVVDDSSPDGTAETIKESRKIFPNLSLYVRPKKEGLGRAYADAITKVLSDNRTEIIITMDADLSHNPEYLPKMMEEIKENDFVVGSRYIKGGSIVGWEPWRRLLSRFGNLYCRIITQMPIHDCTSGFGCIRADLLRCVSFSDFDPSGYAFLMYLKYKAWKLGARIKEIPICFKNRENGESKITMNIIEEGILLPWKLIGKKHKNRHAPACPVCQKNNTKFWFTKNDTDVYRCKSCRLIFIYPIPNQTKQIYSSHYFYGANDGFGYINYEEDKNAKSREFGRYLNFIEKFYPQKGHLLDVGTATGTFLSAAESRGWKATGLEISDYVASEGRKKGRSVLTGTLDEKNQLPPNSFDIITFLDVFEHIPLPRETIITAGRLLKPGGLLIFNLPDAGSWCARILKTKWALIIPPEHLHLFNRENIQSLLKPHGFSMIYSTKIGKYFKPAYIFQILYTISHFKMWKKISEYIRKSPLNQCSVPINLRDNMFIVAKKNDSTDNN